MNHTPLYITRDDNSRLRLLLATALYAGTSAARQKLRAELDRAIIVEPTDLPPGVVTMDSHVEFEDLGNGEIEDYTLSSPDRAKVEAKRLSILAPIGTALIGYREGDIVQWTTPGGVRRLKIRRVAALAAGAAVPPPLAFTSSR